MTGVLIKRGSVNAETDMHSGKTETQGECHMKTEDWSEASTSEGAPKIAGKLPETRKKQGGILLQVWREHDPADTLLSGFWPPELETTHFCCSSPPSFSY